MTVLRPHLRKFRIFDLDQPEADAGGGRCPLRVILIINAGNFVKMCDVRCRWIWMVNRKARMLMKRSDRLVRPIAAILLINFTIG